METIMNYLDNMFMNFPQTPQVLRAKENLAEMMEDKYNELIAKGRKENEAIGIVISEFGNIQELADEFGIGNTQETSRQYTTESRAENYGQYTAESGKENYRQYTTESRAENYGQYAAEFGMEDNLRYVSNAEADEYLFAVTQSANKIAAGVFLCICSPILIILLEGMQESILSISDGMAEGVGVTVLLLMVACAVGLFISAVTKLDMYEYLKKDCFVIDEEFAQTLCQIRESRKGIFTVKIMAGVIMCILSVIPFIIAEAVMEYLQNDFLNCAAPAFLLFIIGIAVSLFITAGMEDESYKIILQEKEYAMNRKAKRRFGKRKIKA